MIRYFFSRQFLGFLGVGGFAAMTNWLSRLLFSVWLPFSWAVILAYGVGMTVAFFLNSFFVFPKSEKARHKQARDFVIVNLAFIPVVWLSAIGINQGLLWLGMVHYTEELAHAISLGVPMLATFLIYKFFAFGESRIEPK